MLKCDFRKRDFLIKKMLRLLFVRFVDFGAEHA